MENVTSTGGIGKDSNAGNGDNQLSMNSSVPPRAGSTMSLSSAEESLPDCFSLEADGIDLDEGFDEDLSLRLGQDEAYIECKTGVRTGIEPATRTNMQPVLSSISSTETEGINQAGIPVFTQQDEIDELANLTSPEIQDIVADLHGITAGVDNLQIKCNDDSKKAPPPHPAVLSRLEDELSKLPVERKATYCEAVLKCPGLVSDERKMVFLEREGGDPALAAVRLAMYWELRLEIFGPERCFLPMTLNGAMEGEAENMVRWPIHQLLPVKDAAGRAIWYFDGSRRDFDAYSIEKEFMAFWYLIEVAMEDPETFKHGLVVVANGKDVKLKHLSPKGRFDPPLQLGVRIFEQAMPIRLRAYHYCHLNRLLWCVSPMLLHLFGRYYRQRLKLHRGSEANILQILEGFCLPKGCLPTAVGGKIVPSMARFLANRLVLESFRPDPRGVLDQQTIAVPTGLGTNRPRSDDAAAEAEFRRVGRADQRMTLALNIRLEKPNLSLKSVLLTAGYTFSRNENGHLVDADNVTLKQRKNNLCRRVRREKQKRAVGGLIPVEANVQGSSGDTTNLLGAAISAGDRLLELEAELERSRNTLPTGANIDFEDFMDDSESDGEESRDSLYDAILELPDMEETPPCKTGASRAA